MARNRTRMALDDQIIAILDETGEDDPKDAIRAKARELVAAVPCGLPRKPAFQNGSTCQLSGCPTLVGAANA